MSSTDRAEVDAWEMVAHRLATALQELRTGSDGRYEPLSLPMDAYPALDEYERLCRG